MTKIQQLTLAAGVGFLLTGCSFTGLRTPSYDGELVEAEPEAIEAYEQSREIVGEEKTYYFRYPFSEDLYMPSLPYESHEPVLLKEGVYTIGVDVPAGRVSLLGNESVFTSENNAVHVGNLIIRDAANDVYFENLFHSDYGQLTAQVDFISGHTIEIIGEDPEITAFYTETIPDDPYGLMEPPEMLVNLDRLTVQQPLTVDETEQSVTLTAGIYEVGVHLKPGTYEMQTVFAPHNTEMFHFRAGEEPRVYELVAQTEEESLDTVGQHYPTIQLAVGDKIYPNLVHTLELVKTD